MSYQVFARKYRPRTFADVLGQDHVVQTLENAIAQDRLAHAYLFVGPRGTGKTSTARILAKALNCTGGPKVEFDPDEEICVEIAEGRSLDVLEIDGASNNGVDQVRDLRESVKFAPACGQFKIYYIDEVHMLTTQAFNALLKTLEEPPPHVKFIFATTEPTKILPTIISRCQRFDLRRIPSKIISDHLLHIAKLEGIELDPIAAHTIAVGSEGGMRDAQSMLDQLVAFCGNKIGDSDVLEIFGFTAYETVADLAGNVIGQNPAGALEALHTQSDLGKDLTKLLADLIGHFRNLLVYQVDPGELVKEMAPEAVAVLADQCKGVAPDRILRVIDVLAEVDGRMKWAPNKKLHFEIGLIHATQVMGETSLSEVIQLLSGDSSESATTLVTPVEPTPQRAVATTEKPAPKIAPKPASTPDPKANPQVEKVSSVAQPEPISATNPPDPEGKEVGEERKAGEPVPAEIPEADQTTTSTEAGGEDFFNADPEENSKAEPGSGSDPLWDGLMDLLNQKQRLLANWIEDGVCRGFSDGELKVSFPESRRTSMESLSRPNLKAAVEKAATKVAGVAVTLVFDVDPSLPEPVAKPGNASAASSSTEGGGEALPDTEKAKKQGVASSNTTPNGGADAGRKAADAGEGNEDFFEDGAIRDALRIFKAKIEN